MAGEPILSQVALEIRYTRGMVYLDRCGSLYVRMGDELGAAFSAQQLPTIEHTEFLSKDERLTVRFGPRNLVIFQQWVTTPARVEQLAPKAWNIIADGLNVKGHVFRCGIRFMTQWECAAEESNRAVLKVIPASAKLVEIFGSPSTGHYVHVFPPTNDKPALRLEVAAIQNRFGELPKALVDRIPRFGVQLDLDYVMPGSDAPFDQLKPDPKTYTLSIDQLRHFLRTSWESAQAASLKFSEAAGL